MSMKQSNENLKDSEKKSKYKLHFTADLHFQYTLKYNSEKQFEKNDYFKIEIG